VNAYQPSYRGSFEFFVVRLSPAARTPCTRPSWADQTLTSRELSPSRQMASPQWSGEQVQVSHREFAPCIDARDAVIATLSPAGQLLLSTKFGGAGARADAACFDPAGNLYVGGDPGTGFPVYQAYQPNEPATNNAGFIAKFMGTTVAGRP